MKSSEVKPIFYSSKRSRWNIFLAVVFVFAIFVATTVTAMGYSILNIPEFQNSFGIEDPSSLIARKGGAPSRGLTVDALQQTGHSNQSINIAYQPTPKTTDKTPQKEVVGYFVNWDPASFASLKQNLKGITTLTPEWGHISKDGDVISDNKDYQKEVTNYVRRENSSIKIVPLINNYNSDTQSFDPELTAIFLKNETKKQELISNAVKFVKEGQFDGVSIDFENMYPEDMNSFHFFMRDLYARFKSEGLAVSASIPLDDDDFSGFSLSEYSDYLILMAYDEHWAGGEPGAISSQNWFKEKLAWRLQQIPAEKVVVALGQYGYDWQAGTTNAVSLSYDEVMTKAKLAKATFSWDSISANPYFTYVDNGFSAHTLWFLDGITAYNQIKEAQNSGVKGFAMWRLGSEDPQIWALFTKDLNNGGQAVGNMQEMQYGYGINYLGTGETIKIKAMPTMGSREITEDPTTKVLSEKIVTAPNPYTVQRYGLVSKKVALTFDDGPTKKYTTKILDTLKNQGVRGTFFIIGALGNANRDILQRIYNEGNEIGNHTFSHPNLELTSTKEALLEINATQKLIESATGRSTLLFRPPYGEDVEPQTPSQLKTLITAGELGYFTVGMNVDPKDWAKPSALEIAQDVEKKVKNGDGNIVLLHDGGGDRTATIQALPYIISNLKEQGYEFVTVSELMGLTRDQIMPPAKATKPLINYSSNMGFTLAYLFYKFVTNLFVVGIMLGISRQILIFVLAVIQKVSSRKKVYDAKFTPSISIVIPALNEAKVIVRTVDNILRSTYNNLGVIVVDDGSTDSTFEITKAAFKGNPKVKIFQTNGGGKSSAINFAVNQSSAELIMVLDADTLLKANAVSKIVRRFKDTSVGAVAGNAKVGNRVNLLTKFQALEYVTSQNLDRRAFALLNSITVVPGAIGVWRKDLLEKVGGFGTDTLAEDAELTLKVLKLGYKVEYEERAISYTEAPENIRDFIKQRYRWMFGTFQAIWKHQDVILKPKYKFLGLVVVPNVIVFQIAFPLVAPILDVYAMFLVAIDLFQKFQHPSASFEGLGKIAYFYLVFLFVDYLVSVAALMLEEKEEQYLVRLLPLQRVLYRFLFYFISIKVVLSAIKGSNVSWGKLNRTTNVTGIIGSEV